MPAAVVFAGLAFWLSGCGIASVQQQSSVDTAMGTVVTQTLYVQQGRGGPDEKSQSGEGTSAESASIIQLLTDLERQELSWRVEGSEVARLNAQAWAKASDRPGELRSIPVAPSMQEILRQVWQISEDSSGALDVTLGRLSRLWNLDELAMSAGDGQIPIPTSEQIRYALEYTDYRRVQLSREMIILPAGMQLDLGAVGKGIACDRICAYLRSQPQITGAVVAVGGSVVTYGRKPDGSPWKVAIMHPRAEGSYLGILSLTGEHYVSTSGDYERYVMADGVRYHHILDPATGYPARSGLCSVTIVCDSGLLADALSTACFVLGPEQGLTLAENYGAEALLVGEDGAFQMTEGMRELFSVSQEGKSNRS